MTFLLPSTVTYLDIRLNDDKIKWKLDQTFPTRWWDNLNEMQSTQSKMADSQIDRKSMHDKLEYSKLYFYLLIVFNVF